MSTEFRDALEKTGWLAPGPLRLEGESSTELLLGMELALRKAAQVCVENLSDGTDESMEQIRNSVLVWYLQLAAQELVRLRRGMHSQVLKPTFASGRKNAGADDSRIRLSALFVCFLDRYETTVDRDGGAKQLLADTVRAAGKRIAVRTIADDVERIRLGLAGKLNSRDWDGFTATMVWLAFRDAEQIPNGPEHQKELLTLVGRAATHCVSLKSVEAGD